MHLHFNRVVETKLCQYIGSIYYHFQYSLEIYSIE